MFGHFLYAICYSLPITRDFATDDYEDKGHDDHCWTCCKIQYGVPSCCASFKSCCFRTCCSCCSCCSFLQLEDQKEEDQYVYPGHEEKYGSPTYGVWLKEQQTHGRA